MAIRSKALKNFNYIFGQVRGRRSVLRREATKKWQLAPLSTLACGPQQQRPFFPRTQQPSHLSVFSPNHAHPGSPAEPPCKAKRAYLHSEWVCVATSQVPAESRASRSCIAAFCTDSPFSTGPSRGRAHSARCLCAYVTNTFWGLWVEYKM